MAARRLTDSPLVGVPKMPRLGVPLPEALALAVEPVSTGCAGAVAVSTSVLILRPLPAIGGADTVSREPLPRRGNGNHGASVPPFSPGIVPVKPRLSRQDEGAQAATCSGEEETLDAALLLGMSARTKALPQPQKALMANLKEDLRSYGARMQTPSTGPGRGSKEAQARIGWSA
jgi:hypothetical protein